MATNKSRPSSPLRNQQERDKLILSHMALPRFIVYRLSHLDAVRRYGFKDMEQVGFLGLIRAAEMWDEHKVIKGKKTKFTTYAYHCIWRKIIQELRHADSSLRKPPKGKPAREKPLLRNDYKWRRNEKEGYEPSYWDEEIGVAADCAVILNMIPKKYQSLVQERVMYGKKLREIKRKVSYESIRKQVRKALDGVRVQLGLEGELE